MKTKGIQLLWIASFFIWGACNNGGKETSIQINENQPVTENVPEQLSESITCKDYIDGVSWVKECTYKGKTLEQVYVLIQSDAEFIALLLPELPPENVDYTKENEEGENSITYAYSNHNKKLRIDVESPMGSTMILITEKKGTTFSSFRYTD